MREKKRLERREGRGGGRREDIGGESSPLEGGRRGKGVDKKGGEGWGEEGQRQVMGEGGSEGGRGKRSGERREERRGGEDRRRGDIFNIHNVYFKSLKQVTCTNILPNNCQFLFTVWLIFVH